MERCGISEDTVIGQACRRIPGKGKESCYLWQEVQREPKETRDLLKSFVEKHPECPFQKKILEVRDGLGRVVDAVVLEPKV